jgi:TFIIF-interacting CTD phosphatase-like protein
MRPGVADFIKSVSPLFDLYFFTSSTPEYSNPIIDAIAPGTPAHHRFTRDNCAMHSGYAVKDLRLLDLPVNRIVLVDDIEGSAILQPRNLIRIAPWYGTDEHDNVLLKQLLPVLEILATEEDLPVAFQRALNKSQVADLHTSQIPDALGDMLDM